MSGHVEQLARLRDSMGDRSRLEPVKVYCDICSRTGASRFEREEMSPDLAGWIVYVCGRCCVFHGPRRAGRRAFAAQPPEGRIPLPGDAASACAGVRLPAFEGA
jgi:hypothetical protein